MSNEPVEVLRSTNLYNERRISEGRPAGRLVVSKQIDMWLEHLLSSNRWYENAVPVVHIFPFCFMSMARDKGLRILGDALLGPCLHSERRGVTDRCDQLSVSRGHELVVP